MKKTVIVSGLVLMFSLSACSLFGGGNNNTNVNQGPQMVQRSGVLRSKNISLQTPGTHRLELSDGTFLDLASKVVSLTDYLDQQVMVEGVLNMQNGSSVLDVASVTLALSNGNENGDLTNAFLQYSGPLSFQFRYPSLFTLQNPSSTSLAFMVQDAAISIDNKTDPVITVDVVVPTKSKLKDWVKEATGQDSVTVRVGDTDGERVSSADGKQLTIYLISDTGYEIKFTSPGGKDENLIRNKFYEMLDTFTWGTNANANLNGSIPLNENMNRSANANKNSNLTISTNGNYYSGEVVVPPATDDTKAQVIAYIKQHLNELKPTDDVIVGDVSASRFEFASTNYVYVEYSDGSNKRRLLLNYVSDQGAIKVSQLAYFVPGDTTDWKLQTGSNDAATLGRDVYDANGSKTATVTEGMRLYENKTVQYSLQYPSNWYYAGSSSKEANGLHQVSFGTKPLDSNPASITLTVFKGTMSSLGISGSRVADGDNLSLYIEKDGRVYRITGSSSLETTMQQMSQTIAQ